MKTPLRAFIVVVVIVCVGVFAYDTFVASRRSSIGDTVAVYYTKIDGDTLAKWNVSLSPNARDLESVAFYATTQAVAGPPPDVSAVRFPVGTIARSAHVSGATATVDLDGAIAQPQSGSFAESGEFKALVWTLTALPGVTAVQIKIGGARVSTLPGGHLELDDPLTRQSF